MNKNYILKFSCPDKSGIQSKVTGLLYKHGAFLTDVKCYSGTESNTFFSRIVYRFDDLNNTNIFSNCTKNEVVNQRRRKKN